MSSATSSSAAAWSIASDVRVVEAVDLVDRDDDRHARRAASAPAMKRSPGPDALLAVEHAAARRRRRRARARRAPACAGSARRAGAGRRAGRRARAARRRASRRRGSRGASSAACRRRSRPCRPTIALTSVDLPTFGRPASATKPDAASLGRRDPGHDLALHGEHLAVVGLVVHAGQVQRAVDDRLAQVGGVLGADDDVAELARARRRVRRRRSGTTARRSGRPCRDARALSSEIRSAPTNSTATWPSSMPADASASASSRSISSSGTRRRRRAPRSRARRSSRSSSAAAIGRAQLGRPALGVLGVGLDDPLHEPVAHDVLAAEAHEVDARRRPRGCRATTTRPDASCLGRSICVTSPVTTIFELKPSRVRNIFICSGVVFCASSRMMKLSLSVRPRMNASGATSIWPRSRYAATFSASSMSCSASNSGRRYGSIFAIRSPGRKPRRSPASTAGRVRMIRLTSRRAQRGGGQRDGEERLAGAGRADPERDRVVADRVDVALLVDGLRRDLLGAVAPDDVLEDRGGRRVLVERAGHRGDRAGRDLVALLDELGELAHDGRGGLHGLAARRRA